MAPPPLRPDRSIVLVGLMGAGKSTVGQRLAKRLGISFIDSDEEVERAARRSIPEIFDRFGEADFRDGERRVIRRLVDGEPKVIATGGGAFVDEETRALILQRCIAVWLRADVETLAERVSRRDHRPLLKDRDAAEVLSRLSETRSPHYAAAHLHVQTGDGPHERTVDAIIQALSHWKQVPLA